MFEWMNRHKKNIMKYTLYLVIPSFVLLYGYGKCAEPPVYQWVAKVNGEEVTDQEWRNQIRNIEERMRQQYGSNQQLSKDELEQQALSNSITAVLMDQKVGKWGIATTDQEVRQTIRQQPYFQDENKNFSVERYRQVLFQNRIPQVQYEESQRNSITMGKMSTVVQQSVYRAASENKRLEKQRKGKVKIEFLAFEPSKYVDDVTPTSEGLKQYFEENREEYRVPEQRKIAYAKFLPSDYIGSVSVEEFAVERFFERNQENFEIPEKRRVRYIAYTPNDFVNDAVVTDAEIQERYKSNPDKYKMPEQVKVRYIVQPIEKLAEKQEITEEEIKEYYEENLTRFEHGEQAKARHILLRVTPGLTAEQEQQVRERLLEIRKEIEEGMPFSEAAEQYSQDNYSAEKGGDLGYFNRGDMVPEFDKIAFDLPLGQVSEPIKTQFGYHLILVEDRKEEGTDSLEEAKDEIVETLKKQKALEEFREFAKSLESLEELKEDYEIKITDWFARGDEIPGIPRRERFFFSSTAFASTSDDRVAMAGNSMSENLYLIEQLDHRESRPMTLEEAQDDVVQDIKQDKAKEIATLAAQEDAEKIKSASLALETVAEDRGLKTQVSDLFSRTDQFIPGFGPRPTAIVNTAFMLNQGEVSDALSTSSK